MLQIPTVEHNKTWGPESKPDFAWCQRHFLTYSLNRYEVKKKKPPEKGSIRSIINCPMCFRDQQEKIRDLKKKKKAKSFPPSAVASGFARSSVRCQSPSSLSHSSKS